MDVTSLAAFGATALVTAMATDTWSWARAEVARVFGRRQEGREHDECARLDTFAGDLLTTAERDVHSRLHGYLEARLADDPALRDEFCVLVGKLGVKLGLEPPPGLIQQTIAMGSVIVQTAGANTQVHVAPPAKPVIRWTAMTGPEAARMLEKMELADAVEAIVDMGPALAARRLSHVASDAAQQLLSHMDEGLASDLLMKLPIPEYAAMLLSRMEPAQAAAILDVTPADWAVARLAEMDPDRALVVLAAMGTKRQNDLVAAMERQETVRLLGGLTKMLAEHARARTTLDLAQLEAERIATDAHQEARRSIESASARADAILAEAQRERDMLVTAPPAAGDGGPAGLHGAPAAAPRMALTLATDFFLIGHDVTGRAHIDQSILETGIAGAVLLELVGAGLVGAVDEHVVALGDGPTGNAVGDVVIQGLTEEPDQSVAAWIRGARRELFLRVAQHMADAGVVVPVARRLRAGVLYRRANDGAANEPAVRVVRHLLNPDTPPDDETYLLITLINLTQLHGFLPVPLRSRQTRELVRHALGTAVPPDAMRAVIGGIDQAVAIIAITPVLR